MSVNYAADELVRVFEAVAVELGLGVTYIHAHWSTLAQGLRTWLTEGSLEATFLEIFTPAGQPVTRFDMQIGYGSVVEDEDAFYSDIESAKFAIKKVGILPFGCRYRIVVSAASWASAVTGWSGTTLRSTDGMRRLNTGALIGSPHISAGMSVWLR